MRARQSRQKSARTWAGVAALSAFVLIFIVFAPAGTCVPKSDGGMDPLEFWSECETLIGTHVSISATQTGHYPPEAPSYGPVLFWATFGALATAGVVYVARLGLTEFLLANAGVNLERGGGP